MFENNSGMTLVTAVGTPVDDRGDLVEDSFRRHLVDQVDRGRVDGAFVLGSMGMMQALTPATCRRCVEAAVDEVGDRARIMVGVGDMSIERALERIAQVKDLDIDAVVATAPYFFTGISQKGLCHCFIAGSPPHGGSTGRHNSVASYTPVENDIAMLDRNRAALRTVLKHCSRRS